MINKTSPMRQSHSWHSSHLRLRFSSRNSFVPFVTFCSIFSSAFAEKADQNKKSEKSPVTIASSRNARELGGATMGEPLLGGKDASTQDLGKLKTAMTAFASRSKGDDFTAIENYLDANPNSPWRVQVLHNLARQYYASGRFSKALATWEKAWAEGKQVTDPALKNIVDDVFGELARMHGRIGNLERLEELQKEVKGRSLTGPGQAKARGAWGGVGLMKSRPEIAFKCGPFALDRVVKLCNGENKGFDSKIRNFHSTAKGTSLAQLYEWSRKIGGGFQMAKRAPGAAVITPCVVHWKVGHFGAITSPHGSAYIIKDGTFLDDFVISKNALDEEASGYFLIPEGELPRGWSVVTENEAAGIWGKGAPDDIDPCPPKTCCQAGGSGGGLGGGKGGGGKGGRRRAVGGCYACGMAEYAFHKMDASLILEDIPIWYEPAFGPSMDFEVSYYQNDKFQPASLPFGNFGSKWTHNYLGFVEYNAATPGWPASAIVYERGGGYRRFTFPEYVEGSTPPYYFEQESDPNPKDSSILKYTPVSPSSALSQGTFERVFPDGSKIVYGQVDGETGADARAYLTVEVDRRGPQLELDLELDDGIVYLEKIIDAAGKETVFSYENGSFPDRITKITIGSGPTERHADFDYDAEGRLISITDMGGLQSQFEYEGDEVVALITPYGKTKFDFGVTSSIETGICRWIEATDPAGAKERLEFRGIIDAAIIPGSEPSAPSVDGITTFDDSALHFRNSFYWNKKVMMESPGDYTKAEIFHWLHVSGSGAAGDVLASSKKPLENRVYFAYAGQDDIFEEGDNAWPIAEARVVKDENGDPAVQVYRYEHDEVGNMTQAIDPIGRITKIYYDDDNRNRVKITQVNGENEDVLWEATDFEGPGMPTIIIDAARETTYQVWDTTFKKIASIINPKGEAIFYTYETNSGEPSYGKLKAITGNVIGANITNIYDAFGRLSGMTDGEGYTLSYQYDDLDRLTQTTYPDGTNEQTIYSRLDAEWVKDRAGHWTHYFYDSDRHIAVVVDPANRVTKYDWCSCGALHGLIDANGNQTKFKQDIQFRTIEKEYADGKKVIFEYESEISRLAKVTDAKNQVVNYKYFVDDNVQEMRYTDEGGDPLSPPTPTVSFTYNGTYNRADMMADGTGNTTYSYYPVTSGNGTLGAARLKDVDGPMDSGATDKIVYAYDKLGRLASRTINGYSESCTYDNLGRIDEVVNPLGTFNYSYSGNDTRLEGVDGLVLDSGYVYFGNSLDRNLEKIVHTLGGGGVLVKFQYGYDEAKNINRWKQQIGIGESTARWDLNYDTVDQLTTASKWNESNGELLEQNANRYDGVGNRLTKQVNSTVISGNFNNLNQLIDVDPGGTMIIEGKVSEPASVTVDGNPATVDSSNTYRGEANVSIGTNSIPIVATDGSSNSRTKNAQVVVSGSDRSFEYDDNGNLENDGERGYEWDAQDRLIAITYSGNATKRSEFSYDGFSRCVRIMEKNGNATISDKRYLWDGLSRAEERASNGTTVSKQYFNQGFKAGSAEYYYVRDHLGSVVGLVDEIGIVRGQWAYDLWGKRGANQIVSNPVESDFTFTSHFYHEESGLVLAPFRSYDPESARWLSRDPLKEAEMRQGPNLYTYVANDPIGNIDPDGQLFGYIKCGAIAHFYADRIRQNAEQSNRVCNDPCLTTTEKILCLTIYIKSNTELYKMMYDAMAAAGCGTEMPIKQPGIKLR